MDAIEIHGGGPPGKGPSPHEWKIQRETIEDLWLIKDLKLAEVMAEMKQLGSSVTERMYKKQFSAWKIGKYASREDYLVIARLVYEHLSRGLPEGRFEVRNRIFIIDNLRNYLKHHGGNGEGFLAKATENPIQTPSYIRCLGSDGRDPPCAHELGHMFKEVNLTERNAGRDAAASQSSAEAADSQYLNPYSPLDPPAASDLRDRDLANASNVGEANAANAYGTTPFINLNSTQYADLPPREKSASGVILGLVHKDRTNSLTAQLLAYAEALAEAIFHLGQLETLATDALGATDLMTINIVSTLSRAHSRMGDYGAALAAIDRGLYAVPLDETHPLGANHPHMLEMIVRKAVLCNKLRRMDETERLYWIAFRGRIVTLGPEHGSTNKAHHSLVVVLQEKGRRESVKDKIQQLVVDPQVAVIEYESWWRRVAEANRHTGRFRASSEEMD